MRLFVAIETLPELRRALARIQKELSRFDASVRWTRPEHLHLTLKFLGEVEEARLPDVMEACRFAARGVIRYSIRLASCGCFPPSGRVNIVWTGVESDGESLVGCQSKVECALAQAGFAPEGRPYTPHLTIGRVRTEARAAALRQAVSDVRVPSVVQEVEEVVLMQSSFKPGGPEHVALARFPLND